MRTTIAAAIVAASLAAACSRDAQRDQPQPLPPDQAAQLLHERVWLDKEPRHGSDRFHLMAFIDKEIGVSQERTIWKGAFEMFLYKVKDRSLDVRLPGSRKAVKTTFRVEKARRGEADVKLTLDKPFAGPTTYYGYPLDGHADADAFVEARFGRLAAEGI
jgi:hypothetical protein